MSFDQFYDIAQTFGLSVVVAIIFGIALCVTYKFMKKQFTDIVKDRKQTTDKLTALLETNIKSVESQLSDNSRIMDKFANSIDLNSKIISDFVSKLELSVKLK